jgi:DHA1 family tetracycline resistance protein-like MFS transporter
MPTLIRGTFQRGIDRAAEIGELRHAIFLCDDAIPVRADCGGLSDTCLAGRFTITLALLGVDYALMAWAPTLAWLFTDRIISGIMGAN